MSRFDEISRLPTDSLDDLRTPTVETPTESRPGVDPPPGEASPGSSPGSAAPQTAEDALELRRGDRLGRYIILERLGAGGMGVVYAAYDPKLDRKIAVKLLRPGRSAGHREQERLLREARALARLDDPQVVKVFDVGTTGNLVFVAMEYVPGCDLLSWIDETSRSVEEIVRVFDAAGRGLAAAHAAGLVHRDFKSNNVLVRDDGQVKVLDFGLARVADDGSGVVLDTDLLDSDTGSRLGNNLAGNLAGNLGSPLGSPLGSGSSSPLDAGLTVTGSILGTPAYMAPEQRRGETLGPAADQFAFCVTLYRALYGRRPFATGRPGMPDALDPVDWAVVEPPEGSRVPARLYAVVSRGLAFDPRDRYPSMEALLADLRHEPWYRRRGRLRLVAGLLAAGLAVGLYLSDRQARALPCRSAADHLAEVWNGHRSLELTTAFADTGEAYALDAARVVRASLDRYGERWVSMHREACEATHLRREQSEDLLDRRIACLESRRRELGTLVDLFTLYPQDTVLRSVEAVSALAPLSDCADTITLMAPVAPPVDAESRASVAHVRQRIAEAQAHQYTDRQGRGLDIAAEAIAAAEELEYWPLVAEAHLLEGLLREGISENEQARDSYQRALLAAQAGRHDSVGAEAFIRLVRIDGYQLARTESARLYGRLARGLLGHLGDTRRQEADLADHLGLMHLRAGELEEAVSQHRLALRSRLEDSRTLDGAAIARTRLRLGNALKELGRLDEARNELEKALALYQTILGSNHPEVAANLDRLGGLALDAGDLEAAQDYYRRAIRILEEVFGEDHVRLGDSLANQALVLLAQGRADEAEAIFARIETLFHRAYGENHPNLAALYSNIGSSLFDQGRPREARDYFERVHQIHLTALGPDHPSTGLSHFNLGATELELDDHASALPRYESALRIWRAKLPADHFFLAHGLSGRARALLGLGRPREAIADTRAALAIWSTAGRDPVHTAETELTLCLALDAAGQPDQAREYCQSARDVLSTASAKYRERLEEAEAWLASVGG